MAVNLKAYPADTNKTEHAGQFHRVIWANPEGTFCFLELADQRTVAVHASPDEFDTGTIYKFHGRWEEPTNGAKYGPRFKADTYTISGFKGRAGVTRYLTDTCQGIGGKTADKLYETYGADAVRMLRDKPNVVADALGLNADVCNLAAEELCRDAYCQEAKIELAGLFARRGFGSKLIPACLIQWGAKAPDVIRKNPFILLGMPSAGFKRCDKLWADLGLPARAIRRQLAAVVHLANTDSTGHTWLPVEQLAQKLEDAIPGAEPLRAFKVALRVRKLAKLRDAAGSLFLASYRRAANERTVADRIRRLQAGATCWPASRVPVSVAEDDRLPSEHQVENLRKATASPVGVFCGGPGTGKTHTLAYLLKEIIHEFGRDSVAVCAPTGKAAVRAQQSLKAAGVELDTRTIHGLLKIGRNGHDGEGWGFEHDADAPLAYKFLIVDESSMIDTDLMAALLAACSAGSHILFVGDPYQLPPVGHGSPLRDFIAGGVPMGELTQVRRNAGQIVHACQRIKHGEDFETCDKTDLDAVPPKNLRHMHAGSEEVAAGIVEDVLKSMTRFNPIWQTQVIVARNKGSAVGRKELNERLQQLLNPEGVTVPGVPFRVNDKIICTRNGKLTVVAFDEGAGTYRTGHNARDYLPVMEPDDEAGGKPQPVEQYVANGEIGRVVAVAGGMAVARFSEGERLVKILIGKQKEEGGDDDSDGGRGCNFDLAYAITCHKMQGSEAPCVIVLVDPAAGGVANCEWHYTALSRASKVCLIIGSKAVLDKQRLKKALSRRKTFLVELLNTSEGVAK